MESKQILSSLLLVLPLTLSAALPDFAAYKDVKQKKAAFFDYMYPMILAESKKVLADRAVVKKGQKSAQLTKICEKYSKDCDIIDNKKLKHLLERVDVIPPSLAMAQGANESAWGTSRFAKKANNLFGQWCFKKGCGIVPARRDSGTKHEVRKFRNTQHSVGAYIFNLNTSRVYHPLRKQRANARVKAVNPSGFDLAKGLIKYSERREAYVKEVRSMISYNKLVKKYDIKFWKDLSQ